MKQLLDEKAISKAAIPAFHFCHSGATVLLVMRCHNSRFLGYVTGEEVYGEGVPCSLLAPGAVGAGNGLILVIRVFHGLANY